MSSEWCVQEQECLSAQFGLTIKLCSDEGVTDLISLPWDQIFEINHHLSLTKEEVYLQIIRFVTTLQGVSSMLTLANKIQYHTGTTNRQLVFNNFPYIKQQHTLYKCYPKNTPKSRSLEVINNSLTIKYELRHRLYTVSVVNNYLQEILNSYLKVIFIPNEAINS